MQWVSIVRGRLPGVSDTLVPTGGLRLDEAVPGPVRFRLDIDPGARSWLQAHPTAQPRVISYDMHRCCGGGKICTVTVRELSPKDPVETFTPATAQDGSVFLVDRRAAARLPVRFGLTVRGIGPLKHLDLDLDGDQWGELLYS